MSAPQPHDTQHAGSTVSGPGFTHVGGFVPPPQGGGPKKGGRKGLMIGLVAAVIAIAGGAFAAYWLLWRAAGPELARYAPKDTSYYLEVPSVTKLAVSLLGVDCVDRGEIDLDKEQTKAAKALADSFEIKKDDAETLLKSIKSIAIAKRQRDKDKDDKDSFGPSTEQVTMLQVGSADDIAPLLKSKRFEKDGKLAGGVKYRLTRRERDVDDEKKEEKDDEKKNFLESIFDELGEYKAKDDKAETEPADGDKKKKDPYQRSAVWFEEERLLVVGNESMIEDVGKVIDGGKESLATGNEMFARSKWTGGSTIIEFMDPTVLQDGDLKKDFFDDVQPMTSNTRFDDEGMLSTLHLEFKGKKLRNFQPLVPEAISLKLHERLPADTAVYLAMSADYEGDGKDYVKALSKAISDFDEGAAKEFDKATDGMKDAIGFGFDTVIDAAGDEFLIAVAGSDKTADAIADDYLRKQEKPTGADQPGDDADKPREKKLAGAFDHMTFIAMFHVGDLDAAEKIVSKLKSKAKDAGDELDVKSEDGGFSIRPSDKAKKVVFVEEVYVAIHDEKYLLVAAGPKKRVSAAKDAFGGEGTLKDDKAHARALKTLDGKSQMVFWADTGRMGRLYLKADEDAKGKLKDNGVPIAALVLEGDDRMTSAFGVRAKASEDGVEVDVSALNYPLFLNTASDAAMLLLPRKKERDRDRPRDPEQVTIATPTGADDLPVIGVQSCDETIKFVARCADRAPPDQGKPMKEGLQKMADAWKATAATPSARPGLEQSCKTALDAAKQNPLCASSSP